MIKSLPVRLEFTVYKFPDLAWTKMTSLSLDQSKRLICTSETTLNHVYLQVDINLPGCRKVFGLVYNSIYLYGESIRTQKYLFISIAGDL